VRRAVAGARHRNSALHESAMASGARVN